MTRKNTYSFSAKPEYIVQLRNLAEKEEKSLSAIIVEAIKLYLECRGLA